MSEEETEVRPRRRRRKARGDRRGFTHLLPQLLTTGNLAAGFYSVTLSASGNLDRAALAILARFNVAPARFEGRFEGLPSPAAAGMVLSSVWFSGFLSESGLPLGVPSSLAGIGVALVGLLMVSPIPYRSFKEVRLPRSQSTVVLMVLIFAVILSKPSVTLFLFGVCYVSSGPVEGIWRWRTGRPLVELEDQPLAGDEGQETTP
jgi:CDP-diacylglycerol--serine O-phosphatidyltransferase